MPLGKSTRYDRTPPRTATNDQRGIAGRGILGCPLLPLPSGSVTQFHFSAVNRPLANLSTFELLPVPHTIFGLIRANSNSLDFSPPTSTSSPCSLVTKNDCLEAGGGIHESKIGPFLELVSRMPRPLSMQLLMKSSAGKSFVRRPWITGESVFAYLSMFLEHMI